MAAAKDELRVEVWTSMKRAGVGAFPFPLDGRIPNFKGAAEAARRLRERDEWEQAASVKSNPDAPQLRVRQYAVEDGKRLFMAVPRLRAEEPFLEIVREGAEDAKSLVSIRGASDHGEPRPIEALPHIDLIIAGSVAVHRDGGRLGKGGGYSDIEFALLQEAGKVSARTTIATLVHPLQVVTAELPVAAHDFPVDLIVTPEEVIETRTRRRRPSGIDPGILSADYIREIPALAAYAS